jgi:hypothetical protein
VYPRAPTVVAIGESLILHAPGLLTLVAMPCVNGNHGRLPVLPKTTGIGVIDDRGAGVDLDFSLLGERERQMLPVDEIIADRMAPTHVPPFIAKGIVLIEEVVFAVVVDHAVRVVHPVSLRREMELGAKRFFIGRQDRGL